MPELITNSLPMGRLAPYPEETHARLHFGEFLTATATISVPPVVDYLFSVPSFPMFGNDTLSDCTAAAAAHLREVWTAYGQGAASVTSEADVIKFYEVCSGYNPANPATDRGAVMQDCLDAWRKTGLAGDKILAFFQINPTDLAEIKAALYMLGGNYVGVNFPRSAMAQFNAGQPWTYDPRADNTIIGGHCVHLGAIDSNGLMKVTTWGRTQVVTADWWNRFVEECWGVASSDWIKNSQAPNGLDTAKLNAAFFQITKGQPGPFPEAPAPAPVPAPPVPVDHNRELWTVAQPWTQRWHVPNSDTSRVSDALKAWGDATFPKGIDTNQEEAR
jgi:hypothetical protein